MEIGRNDEGFAILNDDERVQSMVTVDDYVNEDKLEEEASFYQIIETKKNIYIRR